jgi:tetratricopeptide (TPR) repeat protein
LFVSGTLWIDAFSGRLGPHVDRLAGLLAEEEGVEPVKPEAGKDRPQRMLPQWAVPIGAAAALLVLGVGLALWPAHEQTSDSSERADPLLDTKPVWVDGHELKTKEQVAGVQTEEFEDEIIEGALKRPAGRALGLNPQSASDEDFQTCEKASGDQGIAACDRAIAGGKFTGRNLSYLHNDRGFLRMQKGELDQALVDLDEAIRIDASNFFAFWNRGAVYGAKSDFARAQEDFTKALALNPDDTTKAKIVEALNVVVAAAAAAKPMIRR